MISFWFVNWISHLSIVDVNLKIYLKTFETRITVLKLSLSPLSIDDSQNKLAIINLCENEKNSRKKNTFEPSQYSVDLATLINIIHIPLVWLLRNMMIFFFYFFKKIILFELIINYPLRPFLFVLYTILRYLTILIHFMKYS